MYHRRERTEDGTTEDSHVDFLNLIVDMMQLMSASHCTTTHWPMLKFGGVSSSVGSGLPSTSSLSNYMRKSFNSPSDVLPSISFRENIVYLVCSEHCKHTRSPSHKLCGSCDLASKLNYVTEDELDIDVSIALFRNQTILRWCRVVYLAILHMLPPI